MAKAADTEPHVLKGEYIHGLGLFECYLENSEGMRVESAYRTAVRMSDGRSSPITRTADQMVVLLQPFAQGFSQTYGGKWVLHVEHRVEEPPFVRGSKQMAEDVVMAGPDTPGRRFLIGLRKGKKEQGGLQDMNKLAGMEKVKADVEPGNIKGEDDHWCCD